MDMNQYLSMFIDESNDHLQSLNENMMGLEANPEDISIVQVIFRSAHTLKGMAATMGFEDLASLTHQMENVLDLVRNNKLRMQDFIFDTLFKSLDALEAMVEDITRGGEGKADVSSIVSSLQAIVRGEIPATGNGAASSSVAPVSDKTAAPIHLDEFQFSVLEQSIQEGHQALYVDVTIREDCQLKAVRAYMVFDLLERSGEVVKSFPSVQDIEQEKFDHSFSLYYITQKSAEQIQAMILNLSEIDKVSAVALDQESLQQLSQESAAASEVAATAVAPPATAPSAPATRPSAKDEGSKPAPAKTG